MQHKYSLLTPVVLNQYTIRVGILHIKVLLYKNNSGKIAKKTLSSLRYYYHTQCMSPPEIVLHIKTK